MIKSFRHTGLKHFFDTGSKAGIQPIHAERLKVILAALTAAKTPRDMGATGFRLHQLKGELTGTWAVTVQANWRITFRFEGEDVILVDYVDYH